MASALTPEVPASLDTEVDIAIGVSMEKVERLTVSITGHRPEDIPDEQWTKDAIKEALCALNPKLVIQGMAAGVDLWSGVTSWHLGIPYKCVKPWRGHKPRVADEYMYNWCLSNSVENTEVSPATDYPGVWIYQDRNKVMVDEADVVLAVWSGKTKGGTYACIKYAKSKGKPIYVINPASKKIEGYINKDVTEQQLF